MYIIVQLIERLGAEPIDQLGPYTSIRNAKRNVEEIYNTKIDKKGFINLNLGAMGEVKAFVNYVVFTVKVDSGNML